MSAFDPELFLSQTAEGSMSTQVLVCPAGEYVAVIDDISFEQFQGKKDPSKTFTKMEVKWSIDDAGVRAKLGRDKITVPQQLFIDLAASGGFDMSQGKNVSLGRLREAVGQNGPHAWSPAMLKGNVAKVKVEVESSTQYGERASVVAVTKL